MKEQPLHLRNFLLHVQERAGYDGPVLLKEPASEQATRSHLDQLHNEYAISQQLTDVAGVRPAYAREGTESQPVLLLEYIQGQSLADLLRSTSLDLAEKLLLAVNIAAILSRIHDHQTVHKDVSSGNILVASNDKPGSQGGVYIIDFGLASTMRQESPSRLAVDDILVGTLAYISPEQTGRMNRQVDYRTDLYSLGVTLYELFTGQLPFDSGDPLEMIHSHIARQPQPPHQIDAGIPGPVSDIILKLLAKNAEDRYQTARGLRIDLQHCLDQYQATGQIESLELGADDFTGRLQIPQKLYGRQAEIEQLETVLDRAITGSAQLLLVAGYSGVGKTSLVHELQKEVIAKQAIFVEGKFDQFQQTLPYSAWEQAFAQLVDNWLAGSETSLAGWRESILDAVGDNGQILIDVIPALERIIGPQPKVPQVGGIENQNRFNYYFNRFVSSLATLEHPLVVFLDDLQWIDLASLNLIEALFAVQSTSTLLLIGAYRDNEVGPAHPLTASQHRMGAESDQVTVITLGDLKFDHTSHLLADTLQLNVADCRDLNQVLADKTSGNPFYFRQLLYALESERLLSFDRQQRCWVWEDNLEQSLQTGDNVTELMIRRIQTLPVETRRTLSMAACLGNRFDTSTLDTIIGQEQTDILTALGPALQAGLIIGSNRHFSFAHDRVQEAGYALIPESDRPHTHLEIGRLLLASTPAKELEEEIFAIIGHLNLGRALIEADSDKIDLAAMNLKAGQKANAAAAFSDAKQYVETGIDLLGPDSWQTHYELTLSLHNENGHLAAMTGQFAQIETTSELLEANARNIVDRNRINIVRIEAEMLQYKLPSALEIGLKALKDLGVDIPLQLSQEDYNSLKERLVKLVAKRPEKNWAELPDMTDETALAISALLASEMPTSFVSHPPIFTILSYRNAILTLEYGVSPSSPFAFAGVAAVEIFLADPETPVDAAKEHIVLADEMQQIARDLMEKPITAPSRTKAFMVLSLLSAYLKPLEEAIELTQATYLSGYETGDMLYGGYGIFIGAINRFGAGMELAAYQSQLSDFVNLYSRMGQIIVPTWLAPFIQTAQNFMEHTPEPDKLQGAYLDEEVWLPACVEMNDVTARHIFYVHKLILAYLFDVDNKLDEFIREGEKVIIGGRAIYSLAEFYFYASLSKLRLAENQEPQEQQQTLSLIDSYLQLVKVWSGFVPSTFQHKYDLIAAEKARLTGDLEAALSHYEQAICGAHTNGFLHEEALGNELYARFWAERDNDRFAAQFMREAHSLYRKWGAYAKAEHLTTRYPNWLIGRRIDVDEPGTQVVSDEVASDLDLQTVLKASQDIAVEVTLDSLLAKLMTNLIENSGAQQGYLILEQDGQWMIVAEAAVDDPEPYSSASQDIADTDQLAQGIVQYVARTQETVVLEDASQSGEFVQDPYVRSNQARSILCTPLINQGRTSGILYLENNLAPNVFSSQRVSLLELLSSQIAISIDNARTHDRLEELLEERSRALASAQSQVRTLFEDSPMGIALSSYEGKLLAGNKALLKMLDVTEEELLQHKVLDFYKSPSDRAVLLNELQESGSVRDFGVQVLRLDGSSFFASLNMSKLVLDGEDVLLVMVEDVTSQLAAEQETATHKERARLARELHDSVTQTLYAANILAEITPRVWEKDQFKARENLTQLTDLISGALDEMHVLLFELRPVAAQDYSLGELLSPLVEVARSRARATVNLRTKGGRELREDVTTAMYRIAQECLNNVAKHAKATTVDIDLTYEPEGVVLRIADDGRGFDVESIPAGRHGLSIMSERAQEIGATINVESNPGGGTSVVATWLEQADGDAPLRKNRSES